MDWQLWSTFAVASLVIAIIPGPGVASIIGFAFSSGRRTALVSVAGMALGNATAVSVSLAGAGAILAASTTAFLFLKWLGAAYLVALGLFAIATSSKQHQDVGSPKALSARAAFLSTLAVGTFHPKTILFFVAFASQFISPSQPYLPQAALLVMTFTLIAATTDAAYALAASSASVLVQRSGFRKWTQRVGGGALVAAGVATAAMRR
jgi:threonine/homoserine/homoserine lactone efflux protein